MEAIIGAVGNLLTPSKQSEPVEMPVTKDATNGDAERVIETQVSSICSADSNLDMSAHDTAKHTPVENNPTGRKKIQKMLNPYKKAMHRTVWPKMTTVVCAKNPYLKVR